MLSRLLRIAVAIALTGYILWRSDPSRVLDIAARADWRWVAAAVALVFVDRGLMAYRWLALLVALAPGTHPPFGDVLRVFFTSTFVGTFVPSVGGDVYRAYSLSRLNVRGAESAASVVMDRLLGVLSIVLVGAVAVAAMGRPSAGDPVVIALGIAAVACLAGGMIVFNETAAAAAQRLARLLPTARVQRLASGILDAVRRYAHHHGVLANVLVMSVGVQILRVLQAWCLGRALGIAVPLTTYFVLIPVVLLVMLLPITVNGLGTAQVAFTGLFGRVGVDPAQSFALSVLLNALGVVGNLPGALLYAAGERPRPQSARGG
jgi:uncharacterized protein (TIRG00374 family)